MNEFEKFGRDVFKWLRDNCDQDFIDDATEEILTIANNNDLAEQAIYDLAIHDSLQIGECSGCIEEGDSFWILTKGISLLEPR